ncbi:hypothetical protein EBT31_07375 [bacterium]|nr:hypothetical protein [bacterium]NBX49292.1 hypothetical protein [bacterium]
MNTKELLKGNTGMIILAALSDSPKHGYLITQWIRTHSEGSFTFSAGMLYPLLHKMEQEELITASWVGEETERKKKVYEITPQGEQAYRKLKHNWLMFSKKIQRLISTYVLHC